jgi:hypothetical protein
MNHNKANVSERLLLVISGASVDWKIHLVEKAFKRREKYAVHSMKAGVRTSSILRIIFTS